MNTEKLLNIFTSTAFPHTSGTEAELRVAEFLKAQCDALGVPARIEPFPVAMANMNDAHVYADGVEIPAKGVFLSGSGEVEGELYYMPGQDRVSIAGAKDKIVLMDTLGIGFFTYKDLIEAGAKGILFQYGNMYYTKGEIDERDLRPHVVGDERKVLCAMLNSAEAVKLVRSGAKRVRIVIDQNEYEGASHNVVAELPGRRNEYITLTAHYDSVALSNGAYDNMTGCAGLLGVMEKFRDRELNYGLRFVFCGSEERGLLGSKAYVKAHADEMANIPLNINLDMIGSIMGKFICCVSAEEKLAGYITYMGAELGFPVSTRTGVYPSDSTPFADAGVPALSFCRDATPNVAPIHCRLDTLEVLSMEQLKKDIDFVAEFTRRMADAVICPVSRELPEKVKKDLDEYLFRKRKSV